MLSTEDLFGENRASPQARPDTAHLVHTFRALRPAGGFDLIMADPPWSYEMYSEAGYAKAPDAHYATMSLDHIKAMPVEGWTCPGFVPVF